MLIITSNYTEIYHQGCRADILNGYSKMGITIVTISVIYANTYFQYMTLYK